MFTGIIEETGIIESIRHGTKSANLKIRASRVLEDIKTGDSMNTDGVCLTVTGFDSHSFTLDVMPETLRVTTLNGLKPGSRVNLERALQLGSRLGGHLVSGHVDGTGRIRSRWEEDNASWYRIAATADILKYIVEKGSVAVDGISLTVVRVDDQTFDVSVIPHTRDVTAILDKRTGDPVNIECDLLAKYAGKLLNPGNRPTGIDLDFLAKNDFL